KWLGYQKNDAVYFLYFDNAVKVHEVLINMLKSTEQYIFPPVAVEVWGGMDKQHIKLLGKLTPKVPAKNEPAELIQPIIEFDSARLKCLKIVAKTIKSLPKWHDGKGKKGWIFLNEIVVH